MKTAKFTRHGEQPKYIANAENYKGFLSQRMSPAKSKPFFDGSTLDLQQKKAIVAMDFKSVQEAINAGFSDNLIKWGRHNGYEVVCVEEEVKAAEAAFFEKMLSRQEPVPFRSSPVGVVLVRRVPDEIFSIIKPFGRYWSYAEMRDFMEDVDDFINAPYCRDFAGWNFVLKDVQKVMALKGYAISVDKKIVE